MKISRRIFLNRPSIKGCGILAGKFIFFLCSKKANRNFITIIISGCLLGEWVRFDGLHNYCDNEILLELQNQGRLIPYCPEISGGLSIPRTNAEIVGGEGKEVLAGNAKVMNKDKIDVTNEFIKGAENTLRIAEIHGAKLAILKQSSPSCGSSDIYDGSFSGVKKFGKGVTATLLEQHGIAVFSEDNIADAAKYLRKLSSL